MAEVTYIKIFVDYLDAIEPLGDAERGRLFTSLLTYARTGEAPQLGGNERFLFPMMRAQLDRDIAAMAGVSEARSKAAKASKGSKCEQMQQMQANAANADKRSKDKDKDKDKDDDKKGNGAREARFTPPSIEEVAAYCQERGNGVDAARFVDFYSSKGWMVGKSRMKDWKAAVRNWERSSDAKATPAKKPGYNVQHHDGDLSDLQKAAIQRMLGEEA
nr:MAG TPA: hypothetical protein [Caudoviricetes sp.]